eukprot:15476521-Alexandrium_andersonii.AAC.1
MSTRADLAAQTGGPPGDPPAPPPDDHRAHAPTAAGPTRNDHGPREDTLLRDVALGHLASAVGFACGGDGAVFSVPFHPACFQHVEEMLAYGRQSPEALAAPSVSEGGAGSAACST